MDFNTTLFRRTRSPTHLLISKYIISLNEVHLHQGITYAFLPCVHICGNGVFTLKMHQMFSVYMTQGKFKNTTITGHFGFLFEKNSIREITWLSWRHRFKKSSVFIMFFVHTKTQNRLFKFLHWEDFQRFSFSWQVSVDGRPNLTLFLYGFLPGFRGQLISVTYPRRTGIAWPEKNGRGEISRSKN